MHKSAYCASCYATKTRPGDLAAPRALRKTLAHTNEIQRLRVVLSANDVDTACLERLTKEVEALEAQIPRLLASPCDCACHGQAASSVGDHSARFGSGTGSGAGAGAAAGVEAEASAEAEAEATVAANGSAAGAGHSDHAYGLSQLRTRLRKAVHHALNATKFPLDKQVTIYGDTAGTCCVTQCTTRRLTRLAAGTMEDYCRLSRLGRVGLVRTRPAMTGHRSAIMAVRLNLSCHCPQN